MTARRRNRPIPSGVPAMVEVLEIRKVPSGVSMIPANQTAAPPTGPIISSAVVSPVASTATSANSSQAGFGTTGQDSIQPTTKGPVYSPVAFAIFGEFQSNALIAIDPFLPWLASSGI